MCIPILNPVPINFHTLNLGLSNPRTRPTRIILRWLVLPRFRLPDLRTKKENEKGETAETREIKGIAVTKETKEIEETKVLIYASSEARKEVVREIADIHATHLISNPMEGFREFLQTTHPVFTKRILKHTGRMSQALTTLLKD